MKWLLIVAWVFLMLQFCCGIDAAGAQENEDYLKIENTVKSFIRDSYFSDINSIMQYISPHYSYGKELAAGYAKFKAGMERFKTIFFSLYSNISVDNIQLLSLNIQGNKATVEVEWVFKGFNLNSLEEDILDVKRFCSLIKESGVWKITDWAKLDK